MLHMEEEEKPEGECKKNGRRREKNEHGIRFHLCHIATRPIAG